MRSCPKCGLYMDYDIEYFCGEPCIVWKCVCGYDSSKERTVVRTNTNPTYADRCVCCGEIVPEGRQVC